MKEQKASIVSGNVSSNGNISINKDSIIINLGIAKKVIAFNDISIVEKNNDKSLSLVLKDNTLIALTLEDYLILYKILNEFLENKKEVKKSKKETLKCKECRETISINDTICKNCGCPLKKSNNILKFIIVFLIIIGLLVGSGYGMSKYKSVKTSKTDNKTTEKKDENYESYHIIKVKNLVAKYNGEEPEKTYTVMGLLNWRDDFGELNAFKNDIEYVDLYDYWYDYDYDNDVVLEPIVITCLIIKTTKENGKAYEFLQNFSEEHTMSSNEVDGISILKKDGTTVKLTFTNEYVSAVNNGVVGNVGNYYYYITAKDKNAINEIINVIKEL